MAHLTSCPALHAARVALRQYEFVVRLDAKEKNPKLEADERCIAIVIDYGTQIFNVVQLRPELRYWQQRMLSGTAQASDIAGFLKRLIGELEKMPAHDPREEENVLPLEVGPMRSFQSSGGGPSYGEGAPIRSPQHIISRPAMEAARLLYSYYDIQPQGKLPPGLEEKPYLALLIDAGSEAFRCVQLAPRVRRQQSFLLEGKLTAPDVARFLRYVGLELEHLPGYEEREEEVKLLAA